MTSLDLSQTTQNGRNTQGVTPIYRPTLSGEALDISVSKLEIAMGEFAHDQVTITATSPTITDSSVIKNKAISFYYGLSPRTELFTGYVESVQDDQSATGTGLLHFTIVCLGATKTMQIGQPRFWTNTSIPRTIENLAYLSLLGFHGHDHPYTWPVLAQVEDTDWKTACQFADRIGWSIFNRYGVVMCYDPTRLFSENGAVTDLVSASYASTGYEDYERALVEFVPIEGSDVAYRLIGSKMAFFNGDVVQTDTQVGERFTTFKWLANTVARNPQEAAAYVNRTSIATSTWSQQAIARVLGNASILPGMCVNVFTTNPKYVRDRFNGRWLVRSVAHNADRQTFQTLLTLARPSASAGISTGAYVPFWNQRNETQQASINKTRPTLTLNDNRWSSSWADRRVGSTL